jgi:hypothetical protein
MQLVDHFADCGDNDIRSVILHMVTAASCNDALIAG